MKKYTITVPSLWIIPAVLTPIIIFIYFQVYIWWANSDYGTNMWLWWWILVFMGILGYFYWKSYRRKAIIEELRSRWEYRDIIIRTLDERITGWKNPRTYYIFICEDTSTEKLYESEKIDDIEDMNIDVGDVVHLYESREFPEIYWVDLNCVEKGRWRKKLSQEEIEEWEDIMKEVKNSAKKTKELRPLYWVIIFWIATLMLSIGIIPNLFFLLNWIETTWIVTKIEPNNYSMY